MLILGYGNPLRGDDGVGPAVAELLRRALPEAEIIISHQMTPELCEAISQADMAVFVDSAVEGAAGEIRRRDMAPDPAAPPFSHHATPGALLHMAAVLYGHAARGVLYSVAGVSFELGEGLSPQVAQSVHAVADAIVREAVGK